MLTYLIITLLISFLLTAAFLRFYQNLHQLGIIVYWFLITAMMQIFKDVILDNQSWIKPNASVLFFWTQEIDRFVAIPCLTMWLFDVFLSKTIPISKKLALTFGWFLILIGFQYLNRELGYFRFRDWNAAFSLIEWLILFAVISGFALFFRTLLKKEAFIR